MKRFRDRLKVVVGSRTSTSNCCGMQCLDELSKIQTCSIQNMAKKSKNHAFLRLWSYEHNKVWVVLDNKARNGDRKQLQKREHLSCITNYRQNFNCCIGMTKQTLKQTSNIFHVVLYTALQWGIHFQTKQLTKFSKNYKIWQAICSFDINRIILISTGIIKQRGTSKSVCRNNSCQSNQKSKRFGYSGLIWSHAITEKRFRSDIQKTALKLSKRLWSSKHPKWNIGGNCEPKLRKIKRRDK